MADKILLFIPMYNCEKQITRVLGQLDGEIRDWLSEVIVVNNRSTDNGERAVIEYLQSYTGPLHIKLLRNDENYGLGGSHKVAFNYAIDNGFDYVIVLHGDDQGSAADLLPLLKNGTYKNFDCCLGGRFVKGSRLVGYSKFRTLGNRVFNIIFTVVTGKRIYDLGAGLNLYSVPMLRTGYYRLFADNLTFNCYMLFALSAYHQKHMFFPIVWREEDQVSNVKMTKQAMQTLKMAIRYFFGRTKYLTRDMRTVMFAEYSADVVYEWKNKETGGGAA